MISLRLQRLADRAGCSLSVACAIHCLATPLFVTFLSATPLPEQLEMPMVIAALALATTSFSAGFVRHATILPLVLLLLAAPLMIASRLVPGTVLEPMLLVAGAMLLSAGHVVSLRRSHACKGGELCG